MAAQNMANTKAELIAALVQKELVEKASLLPYGTDLSSLAVKGYNQISVPKLSSFTVQSRSFGAAVSENAGLSDSVDTLNLDQNKIVLFGYDDADAMQSSIDYKIEAIRRAVTAHGVEIIDDVITEWEAVANLSVNGATPADITASNILDMREELMEGQADFSNVSFHIAPDQEKVMLGLAEFSRYDYRGGGVAPLVNGVIGSVYGVPVVINTRIKAQQAFMVEKTGWAYAFQKQIKVAEENSLEYGTDGKKVAVDCVYGIKGMQIAQAGASAGKTKLIAKLTD